MHVLTTLRPGQPRAARRRRLRGGQTGVDDEQELYGDYATDGRHEAHLGVAEGDLERAGDEEEEDAVVEGEDGRGGGRRRGDVSLHLAPICELERVSDTRRKVHTTN